MKRKKNVDVFKQSAIKLPAFEPWISNGDKNAVLKSLNQTMLTLGPNLEKFETMFAKYTKSRYAVAVSNCTAALHLSLKALGVGKDDEVIMPDLTFVADANAVIATSAKPVIVDIEENGYSISLKSLKKKITRKTKAIIPVHIYGEACKMDEIIDIARSHNIHVVEDCAHAIGTFYKNRHVGRFGIAGCFSFYPTKNITTAEGGMVITDSSLLAKKIQQLRSHGMTKSLSQRYASKYPWVFDIEEPGYNYRLDEIRASLGISQLRRISKINELRKKVASYYTTKLKDVYGIITPKIVNDRSHSYHLYTIRITKNYGISRNDLFNILKKNGIRTTVYWMPLHKYSAYKKYLKNSDFPNSANIYEQILALPLYPTITRNHQDKVIECIIKNQKN